MHRLRSAIATRIAARVLAAELLAIAGLILVVEILPRGGATTVGCVTAVRSVVIPVGTAAVDVETLVDVDVVVAIDVDVDAAVSPSPVAAAP